MRATEQRESQRRLHNKIKNDLGREVVDALADEQVIEIMLNPNGSLWIEKLGQSITEIPNHSCSAMSAISTIASYHNTSVTQKDPIIECELPIDGSRFEGLIVPIVESPSFTIRKKATSIFTLEQYEEQGILEYTKQEHIKSEDQHMPDNLTKKEVIEYAVKAKKNILVVGSTGSGKTTLVNAIIDQIVKIDPDDRLVIIEDTNEIQCAAKNQLILRAKRDSKSTNLLRLLMATMRLRPDRIIIGEVRDAAALELLKAWNTGHPGGCATVHADSAKLGLIRMEQLISEATSSPMQTLIGEAIDIVIFITKLRDGGRVIPEILEVQGYDPVKQKYITKSFR